MSYSMFGRRMQFNNQKPTNPAIIEAALVYLDHCESQCLPSGMRRSDWDEKSRNELNKDEKATKIAALGLLNRWLVGDHDLSVRKGECLPSRAFAALEYLSHCHFGSTSIEVMLRCCDNSLEEARELNFAEQEVKSTSLELLRNWFTGEIELEVVAGVRFHIGANGATIEPIKNTKSDKL